MILEFIARRLRAACRTSQGQAAWVALFTLFNAFALAIREFYTPVWFAVACIAFWPAVAFLANMTKPLSGEDGE
jgi:hypothetical protein